ncbi:MAG TPA: hypothetical protein VGX49_13055 [Jatrophihabitans sp.]|jgi:hypothetical protein|nr:hypothetical protein [Jatrophihabitans sp.]
MTHGHAFDPANDGEIKQTAAEAVDDSLLVRPFSPLDDESRQRIQDAVGELWPATIRVLGVVKDQTGGSVAIGGDGWSSGSTVTFYADGIAGSTAPLVLGQDNSVSPSGRVEGFFDYRASSVPADQQTPVTLRAEGGGESATCSLPDFVFYIN